MEAKKAKELVAETGAILLEKELVARTWGNISCRIDETAYAVTPSGLDYQAMSSDDIPVVGIQTGKWTGKRKPSGEKGVHTVAYQIFPEVNFVIHTHQTYATALSLQGLEKLELSEVEKQKLGTITLAEYGLPGTKTLTKNVETAMNTGAQIVLMAHHGAIICGQNREDTIEKAELLETVCRRFVEPVCRRRTPVKKPTTLFAGYLKENFGYVELLQTPETLAAADMGMDLTAQLDDMAQMIGRKIPHTEPIGSKVRRQLAHHNALLIPGVGAMVRAENEEDVSALKLLVQKAAICWLYTSPASRKASLSAADVTLMRLVYQTKYSKLKGEKESEGEE